MKGRGAHERSKRSDIAKLQLACYWALSSLRKFMEPSEILEILRSNGLELSNVDLSRYIGGHVLPGPKRARELLQALYKAEVLEKVLKRVVVIDSRGVVNIARLAFDKELLALAASLALVRFGALKVTKVLTAAVNGVPLASFVSLILSAGLCVAKREAEVPECIEVKYFAPEPPRYISLFIPKGALRHNDAVLIVDDLLRSGRTLKALLELSQKSGAKVKGVFSLVAVGSEWCAVVRSCGFDIYVGYQVALA